MKYFILIFFMALSAQAQKSTPTPSPTPESEAVNPTLKVDTSSINEKRFVAVGQPGGVGPGWIYSVGGSFGFYLDPKIILLGEASLGVSSGATMDNDASSGSRTTASVVGAHLKFFTGKWFYVRGGLDQRNVKWDYTNRNNITKEVVSSQRFEGSSLGITLAVGSQWTFKKFTFGADWVGFHLPIGFKIHTEETVGPTSTNTIRDMQREEERQLRTLQPVAARIYAGVAW